MDVIYLRRLYSPHISIEKISRHSFLLYIKYQTSTTLYLQDISEPKIASITKYYFLLPMHAIWNMGSVI